MMFSSRTPSDLSHDPHPNVWEGHSPFNQMRADTDVYRSGSPEGVFGQMRYVRRPRPEFDHVQHNQPNPILVDFRQDYDGDMRGWGVWFALWLYQEPREIGSPEHIAHARRVLNRLALLKAAVAS